MLHKHLANFFVRDRLSMNVRKDYGHYVYVFTLGKMLNLENVGHLYRLSPGTCSAFALIANVLMQMRAYARANRKHLIINNKNIL